MENKTLTSKGREELKNSFIQLRARGLSYNAIAKELRLAKGTLINWNRELSKEVAQSRAIELEALFDQFRVSKEGRIKRLGLLLIRLTEEIGNRDLSKLPVSKLLELILKYQDAAKEEYSELQETEIDTELTVKQILTNLIRIANDQYRGRTSSEQAMKNHHLLMNIFKVYERSVLEEKIDHIQRVMRNR